MKLVFATNNVNKLNEIKFLVPDWIDVLSLHEINCFQEIKETEKSLEGNALLKSRFIYENFGYDCFSDDTGLEINSLNNEPGVLSARYAGDECNADNNINKVLNSMHNILDRKAKFRTVISLIIKGKEFLFEGCCDGYITKGVIGKNGFGYDPIFKPKGYEMTFAEMSIKEKGSISHRSIAFEKLINFLNSM